MSPYHFYFYSNSCAAFTIIISQVIPDQCILGPEKATFREKSRIPSSNSGKQDRKQAGKSLSRQPTDGEIFYTSSAGVFLSWDFWVVYFLAVIWCPHGQYQTQLVSRSQIKADKRPRPLELQLHEIQACLEAEGSWDILSVSASMGQVWMWRLLNTCLYFELTTQGSIDCKTCSRKYK